MLCMGNWYFLNLGSFSHAATVASAAKYDSHVKDSYKYYHAVLNEDSWHNNVYAANGLAMICAEKGHMDVAKEIFNRLREAELTGKDSGSSIDGHFLVFNRNADDQLCANLGHVYLIQQKYTDAIHVYNSMMKSLLSEQVQTDSKKKSTDGGEFSGSKRLNLNGGVQLLSITSISECLAMAYLRNDQFTEALHVLLRCACYNPAYLNLYYNASIVLEEQAVNILSSRATAGSGTAGSAATADIQFAVSCLKTAENVLHGLRNAIQSIDKTTTSSLALLKFVFQGSYTRRIALSTNKAMLHESFCHVSPNS